MTDFLLRFRVKGVPVAQPRATQVGHGVAFVPRDHAVHGYRLAVALACKEAIQEPMMFPVRGPVQLRVLFALPQLVSQQDQTWASWASTRPDTSNMVKAVEDALNGIVYLDDSQVVHIEAAKIRCAMGQQPFTQVTIGPADDLLEVTERITR